jgi:hypothetical protein
MPGAYTHPGRCKTRIAFPPPLCSNAGTGEVSKIAMWRKPEKLAILCCLVAVGLCACTTDRDRNRIYVDSDDMVPACSRYLKCINPWAGMGMCVSALFTSTRWHLKEMSFYLGTVTRDDWVAVLSGCQNSSCLARVDSGCDQVLECMNRGRVVRGCTPPEGYFGGRYCRDGQTLSVCNDLDGDGINTEISFQCDSMAMECVEMDRGTDRLAACGFHDPDPPEGLGTNYLVTCDGTLAKLQRYGAVLYWNCARMKATCEPGVYADWDQHEFCKSSGPPCQVDTMESHCDGTLLIEWCNGNEIGFDCASVDQTCRQIRVLLADVTVCTYDTACNPYTFEETCQDGEITYCGPDGPTTVSCARYGFESCTQLEYSWFVACNR